MPLSVVVVVCSLMVALLPAATWATALDFDLAPDLLRKDELTELYTRNSEPVPGPIAFGHKYISGSFLW